MNPSLIWDKDDLYQKFWQRQQLVPCLPAWPAAAASARETLSTLGDHNLWNLEPNHFGGKLQVWDLNEVIQQSRHPLLSKCAYMLLTIGPRRRLGSKMPAPISPEKILEEAPVGILDCMVMMNPIEQENCPKNSCCCCCQE